jgi:4-hydroxyphenylacetate 3-monooxygenase
MQPVQKSTEKVTNQLLTGADFLESLRDGREIWFHGERVKDVTTHPAFRNSAKSVSRLYDALHHPDTKDALTTIDRFGITTHKFFAPSYNSQDLVASRDAIAIWQRINYGWLGRLPDYKAAFMAQLAEGHSFYDPYGSNALNWYKKSASQCLFLNHVLIDPPVDRNRARIDVRDVFLSVEKDDDKGIYVSGAKMVATGSALTHGTFVAINSGTAARMETGRDEDMALVFITDMNAQGVKLICRPSYEYNAQSPFDAPLSSRFDENDAVMVFDNAFIPWENVLIYRDVNKCKSFYAASGFFQRYNLQNAVRLATKLDFCIGLLVKGTDATATNAFRGVQTEIGALIALRDTVWSMSTALCYDTEAGIGGTVVPKLQTAAASRLLMTNSWDKVRETFETILAGAPIYTISSYKDLQTPELQPIIERYYRGTGLEGKDRVKLFKLIWDALYSEFAGRGALYERNFAGNQEQQRLDALTWATQKGDIARYKAMVDDCLSDYDGTGWVKSPWQ